MECQASLEEDGNLLSVASAVATWWQFMPIVRVALDPMDILLWPTVWEIIASGSCCEYSRGLAMAYNMYYLDDELPVEVARAYDHSRGVEYMAAIIDGLVLNHGDGTAVHIESIDPKTIDIQERWNIQHILDQQE